MDNENFLILHRHWMWCNVIKKHFEGEVKKLIEGKLEKKAEKLMPDRYGAYMSIWYALLFVVLEGLKERKVTIPEIADDINGVYESLHLYRNAVFHPQNKYWSPKLLKIMEDKDSVDKIWRIHNRLGKFFLDELNKNK